jgi:hypothetical protein
MDTLDDFDRKNYEYTVKADEVRVNSLYPFFFQFDKKIPKPEPIITIGTSFIATPGNIITIAGAPKSGKSNFIVSSIITGLLHLNGHVDTLGLTIKKNELGGLCLTIDTEHTPYQHDRLYRQAFRKSQVNAQPDWLKNYLLRGLAADELMKNLALLLRYWAYHLNSVFIVILDGVADFVESINDEKECNLLVRKLENLARQYNCVFVCVLHHNKGTKFVRGHLGSQLERKSESVLTITNQGENNYIVEGTLLRNSKGFQSLRLCFEENEGFMIYKGVAGSKKDSESAQEKRLQKFKTRKDEVFKGQKELPYQDFINWIKEEFIAEERTAKKYKKEFEAAGLITSKENGKIVVLMDGSEG